MIAILTLLAASSARPSLEGEGSRASRFSITQVDASEGLPQSSVRALAQSADGYLLVGTFGGLARFDGLRFQLFDAASEGLPDIRFTALHVARDGRSFAGTEHGHIGVIEGRALSALPDAGDPPLGVVNDLTLVDGPENDVLWVASDGGLSSFDGQIWRRFPETGAMTGLAQARGEVYATGLRGLWRVGSSGPVLLAENGSSTGIEATDSHVFLTSVPKVAAWSIDEGRLLTLWDPKDDLVSSTLAVDGEGVLWVGTKDELLMLGPTGALLDSAARGRPIEVSARWPVPGGVHVLFVDRESNLWAGESTLGLVKITPLPFSRYSTAEGLPSASLKSLEASVLPPLIATVCDGLYAFEGGRFSREPLPGDDECVFAIERSPRGGTWIGQNYTVGLLGGDAEVVRLPGHVLSLHEDSEGALWIGTEDHGAFLWRDGHLEQVDVLRRGSVASIVAGGGGELWLAGTGGIAVISEEQERWYGSPEGFPPLPIRAIRPDEAGRGAWLGSYGGGLLYFDGEKITKHIRRQDGLPDDAISAILSPDTRDFWINSNRGVFRIARSALDTWQRGGPELPVILFPSGEGNGGASPPAGIDPSGRLWFATIDGAVVFDPKESRRSKVPPIPVIESIDVDGLSYSGASVEAPAGDRDLTVRFTAAALSYPKLARFQYRLLPLDASFREPSSQREVRYSRLPPGHYTFEVRAANEDGVWSTAPAQLEVTLAPYFYERAVFRWTVSLGFAAAIALAVSAWSRAQRKRAAALRAEIEQRLQIEARLRRSEAHYRSLFESASDGLLLTDPSGTVIAANSAAGRLFGCEVEGLVGRARGGLVREDPAGGGRAVGVRVDGSELLARVVVADLDDGLSLMSVVDIGSIVALQERTAEAQRLAAVGRLAGGIAHDFNNLLTVVRGNAVSLRVELAARGAAEAGWLEALDHIEGVTRRGSDLTRQLLAFGQQQTLRPEPVELSALLQRMKPILMRLAPSDLAMRFDSPAPASVLADPSQLELVLVNLVLNAIDATSGRGEIRISLALLGDLEARKRFSSLPAGGERWAVLSVADTGAGITPDVLPHLFEPFFTTRDSPGRGLGLASVHGFVTQSRGAIEVASVPGVGSRFDIALPILERSAAEPVPAAPSPDNASPAETRVLLCDDDPLVRRTIERVLRGFGYQVRSEGSPSAAIALFERERFDLLVTDVLMPEMNGVELVQRIRARLPALPVVYVSGYTKEALPPELNDPVVAKPFDPQTLLRVVRQALGRG